MGRLSEKLVSGPSVKKKKAAILSLKLPNPFVSAAAELAGGVLGSWSGLQAAWPSGCGRGSGPLWRAPRLAGRTVGAVCAEEGRRLGIVLTSLHSPLPSPPLASLFWASRLLINHFPLRAAEVNTSPGLRTILRASYSWHRWAQMWSGPPSASAAASDVK